MVKGSQDPDGDGGGGNCHKTRQPSRNSNKFKHKLKKTWILGKDQ